jgi:hypothetical protein
LFDNQPAEAVADEDEWSGGWVRDLAPASVEEREQGPCAVANGGVGVVVEGACVVAEGEDACSWPFFGEELPGPEDRGVFVPPCPRFGCVAVQAVNEDKTGSGVYPSKHFGHVDTG